MSSMNSKSAEEQLDELKKLYDDQIAVMHTAQTQYLEATLKAFKTFQNLHTIVTMYRDNAIGLFRKKINELESKLAAAEAAKSPVLPPIPEEVKRVGQFAEALKQVIPTKQLMAQVKSTATLEEIPVSKPERPDNIAQS